MSISPQDRPLSPHLQIYRLPITALTSISHRLSGVALFAGSLLLVGWLWGLAYDGEYYAFYQEIASHWVAKIILMGWTLALCYHLVNGLRHLLWDMGRNYDKNASRKSSYVVIALALGLTIGLWCSILKIVSFNLPMGA